MVRRSHSRSLGLALLLPLLATAMATAQQTHVIDTLYFCGTGGFSHNYIHERDPLDIWGFVSGIDSTHTLTASIHSNCGSEEAPLHGYLDVWDGDTLTGTLLINHFTGSSLQQTYPVSGSRLTFHLHYDGYSLDTMFHMSRYLTLQWSAPYQNHIPPPCIGSLSLSTQNITTTEADIVYWPDTTTALIEVDGRTYITNGGTLHLSGLTPNTHYTVKAVPVRMRNHRCCFSKTSFYTHPAAHWGCPDVLDLYSDYVRCFEGPGVGRQDDGPQSAFSRHTVHTDPNERDAITGGGLRTVCPGKPGSVRLGNWFNGESESIIYYLHVDTTLYSLILLHYAAVLQNPGHHPDMQPRFTMRILDQNNSVIDEQCGAADFVSDSTLGWNSAPMEVLWKDWTTVGINLAQYHGQDVRLQLSTCDCALGGHFGYAYFYAECQQPYATADHCGTIDTVTLTAPDGFNYLWYYDSPSHPISTERSVTCTSSEGDVHCRLSFVENPSCYITMNSYVRNFWPLAVIDTLFSADKGCDGYTVQFLNRSTIIGDDSLPLPGQPPCETAVWAFGDGQTSTEMAPSHTFFTPGPCTVTLIAGLANGLCGDTARLVINVPDLVVPVDTFLSACDSMIWRDGVCYHNDTVGPTWRVRYYNKCDTAYILNLTIVHSPHTQLETDTFCYSSTYTWRDQTVGLPRTDTLRTYRLTDTLRVEGRCDSILFKPLLQLPPDTLSIEKRADCDNRKYLLKAVTDCPRVSWQSNPTDSLLLGHTLDHQLWALPDAATVYTLTSYRTVGDDSLFCPTTTSLLLRPVQFPRAELLVNPEYITPNGTVLHAYDLNPRYLHRQWMIVPHGTGLISDTLFLPDTTPFIDYQASLSLDSLTVLLVVRNETCDDTAQHTLPVVLSILFAPNVFTPSQAANNRFAPVGNDIAEAFLTIYNRQGLLVFSTDDLGQGWDGTHHGTPCPQGAYVWHLRWRHSHRPDEWHDATGTVTLLR